jgi:hypothetical protein
MSERPRWTAESVARSTGSLTPADIARESALDDEEGLAPYLGAAALVTTFDPQTLKPLEPTSLDPTDAIAGLLDHSSAFVDDGGEPHWALSTDARREALARFESREDLRAALARISDRPDDAVQRAFEAAIAGALPPLSEQDAAQLTRTLQVSTWLDGVLGDVPDPAAVRRALERHTLLAPFRALVGDHFGGRRKELARLRSYVDVLVAHDAFEAFGRALRDEYEKRPLLIHGVGGAGKSTLVAQFILEHLDADGASELPFAYIDFDRTGVMAEEPVTLLLEAARQLSIQREWGHDVWERLRLQATQELAALGRSRGLRRDGGRGRAIAGYTRRSPFLRAFVDALDETTAEDLPFLLVLDTFEEVQYRSADVVRELGSFLSELQSAIPRLRTVIAGRAPIGDFETEELELGALDDAAAVGYLRSRGIADSGTAKLIASRLNGNPLALALAARAVIEDPAELATIKAIRTRRRGPLFFLALDAEVVQGYLYRRILGHIHDEQVRRLAHPGLVLRRITPELILEVLSDPCGVQVDGPADAERLFAELRAEVTLVKPGGEEVLEHRADVRRMMLPLIERDAPGAVERIHRSAVAFYERREGVVDRAEEIYHRLFVEDLRDAIDERWLGGVEAHLAGALEELPAEGQVVLAPLVGREPSDPTVWERAGARARERRAEKRVDDLIALDRLWRALEVLQEAKERTPGGRLHLLEPTVHLALGDLPAAKSSVERGLAAASGPGGERMVLELLELAARIQDELGDGDAARARLVEAYAAAKRLGERARMLELGTRLARLAADAEEDSAPVLAEVHADFLDAPDRILEAQPAVTRELAGELGEQYPDVLLRAARTVGLPGVEPEELARPGAAEQVAAKLRRQAQRKRFSAR